MKTQMRVALVLGGLVILAAPRAIGQTSTEIEELRREYDQQLRVMQQAFEERIAALEEQGKKLEEQETKKDSDFTWYWKDGLRFDTADGRFKMKFGGRIQWDNAWFDEGDEIQDTIGDFENGAEFRRARLEISGDIYKDFEFKAQYDFVDGEAGFKDVFMAANNIPVVGQLKAGHFKEPFGLEELTSSKDDTFMEQASITTFIPSRNAGIMASNNFADDRILVNLGVFREADEFGDSDVEEETWSITGRVSGRPWLSENGFLHLGAAGSYRMYDGQSSTLRYRERPEAHLADHRLVDTRAIGLSATGNEELDSTLLGGLEAAFVYGPFSAQGEFIYADVNTDTLNVAGINDPSYYGYYLYASYFLTGESRPYKADEGYFDKIKPNNNFQITGDGGPGAWELGLRFSHLDLDDETDGGVMDDITLGVNWYLNPNMKIMLNYVYAMVDDRTIGGANLDDDMSIVQTRMQVTW